MPKLADRVIDFGLAVLDTEVDRIVLCSAEPSTYTEATSTLQLGFRAFSVGTAVGPPASASPNGRKVTVSAVLDGTATATGTAVFCALVDTINARLLEVSALLSPLPVSAGQVFQLQQYDVQQANQ